jgi:hypothetical protein
MKKPRRDPQLIEIAGRNWLVSQLIQCGIEVATPERDKGVDLIAYVETQRFRACRIQIKVSTGSAFVAHREQYDGMLMVYIWHIDKPQETVAFAMRTWQARRIITANRWDKNQAWKRKNGYWRKSRVAVDSEFYKRYLQDRKMDMKKWKPTILGASTSPARKDNRSAPPRRPKLP